MTIRIYDLSTCRTEENGIFTIPTVHQYLSKRISMRMYVFWS